MDQELLHFSLSGSRQITRDVISPGPTIGIPWMNDLMWAELHYLNKVKPFSEEILTNHIEQNPEQWNKLFDLTDVSFSTLPNKALFDMKDLHESNAALP